MSEYTNQYPHSFAVAGILQALLSILLTLGKVWLFSLLTLINMALTLLVYPWILTWLERQDWSSIPPEYGRHQ